MAIIAISFMFIYNSIEFDSTSIIILMSLYGAITSGFGLLCFYILKKKIKAVVVFP